MASENSENIEELVKLDNNNSLNKVVNLNEKHRILDTSAIIKGYHLQGIGHYLYTIPEVYEEIKDETTRLLLKSLPFEIIERNPMPEDIELVIKFSKKTGDFTSLSSVDIKVIALGVTIEKQFNGSKK